MAVEMGLLNAQNGISARRDGSEYAPPDHSYNTEI